MRLHAAAAATQGKTIASGAGLSMQLMATPVMLTISHQPFKSRLTLLASVLKRRRWRRLQPLPPARSRLPHPHRCPRMCWAPPRPWTCPKRPSPRPPPALPRRSGSSICGGCRCVRPAYHAQRLPRLRSEQRRRSVRRERWVLCCRPDACSRPQAVMPASDQPGCLSSMESGHQHASAGNAMLFSGVHAWTWLAAEG